MACSTAGLIPDALLGLQGAAFVCLPTPGVPEPGGGAGSLGPSLLAPALPLPADPSWYLLGTCHVEETSLGAGKPQGLGCRSFFLLIS